MNIGIEQLVANLGMSFENLLLFVFNVGTLIFFAVDFKIGAIISFLTNGLLFMAFYAFGLNYEIAVWVWLAWLVIMSLSLFTRAQASDIGA